MLAVVGLLCVSACTPGTSDPTSTSLASTNSTAPTTTLTTPATTAPSADNAEGVQGANEALAESFVDALLSFNPTALAPFLVDAGSSAPFMTFLQGWLKGGNTDVIDRQACVAKGNNKVTCAITVDDDFARALEYGFNATDTIELFVVDGTIRQAAASPVDRPLITYEAVDWVFESDPELLDGPCAGYFEGGPTPQACAEAMLAGVRKFVEAADDSE